MQGANDLMPEVNGRGLIGKNQPPNTSQSIYSGFRPAKIKKSKRSNFLTTNSFSPTRTRDAQGDVGGLSNTKQDPAIVNMTPLNQIPQNLVNSQAAELELQNEPQSSSLYKLPQGAQSYGIMKYSLYPDEDLSSQQSAAPQLQQALSNDKNIAAEKNNRKNRLSLNNKGKPAVVSNKKAADTQVDMPLDMQHPQQVHY